MPFDFIDRSDRAVLRWAFGETIVGYCLDRDNNVAGFARVVEGIGV